jgi:hypothetical protein
MIRVESEARDNEVCFDESNIITVHKQAKFEAKLDEGNSIEDYGNISVLSRVYEVC